MVGILGSRWRHILDPLSFWLCLFGWLLFLYLGASYILLFYMTILSSFLNFRCPFAMWTGLCDIFLGYLIKGREMYVEHTTRSLSTIFD
jgi:hypothetical protein